MRNYQEQLEFAKQRAMQYIELGDVQNAYTSFASDMESHPETRGHSALDLGLVLMITGNLLTPEQMKKFIEGFN
jgi:hypothetical protein